jgi:hypothetical protein
MGLIPKVAKFLGVSKFGQAIGTAFRNVTGELDRGIRQQQEQADLTVQKINYAAKNEKDPAKRTKLLQMAHSVRTGVTPQEQIDPGLNLSNKEIIGSAANVALNIATPGAFKGGKMAVIGKNAALGSAFGGASGLERNRSAGNIVGSAVGGALVGAGIGTAGLVARAAKEFATRTTPRFLMDKAIKPALQDLKKNVRYGTKTLSQELLDEGVKGKPETLLRLAKDKLTSLEDELQEVITSPGLSEVRVTRQQIRPYLSELVAAKKGVPGLAGEAQKIVGIWKSMPETMTLPEANTMKRRIYTELEDIAYRIDARLGTRAAALKQLARGLKTEIEKAVGGTVVRDINKKLSIYGRLQNSMVDQMARSMRNNGVGLTDAILIAGGDTGILALLRHLGQGAETYAAQGLYKARGVGTGIGGRTVKSTLKRATLNAP